MKYPLLWKAVTLLCTQACFTPALAAPVKSSAQSSYTVKSGDTFAKIARSKGISLGALLQANRIENPNHIVLGQQIVLPGTRTAAAKPVTTTAPAVTKGAAGKQAPSSVKGRSEVVNTTVNVTPPAAPGTWTVRTGDTLTRIQRQTGTPVATLLRLNGLTETSTLRVGQTLRTTGNVTARKAQVVPEKSGQFLRETETPRIMEQPAVQPLAQPAHDRLPVTAERSAAPAPTGTAPHKVQSGETFTSIRRVYGLSEAQLASANRGVNPGKLRIGQTIMIPGQPVRPQAKPLLVRADGRVLADSPDPLATDNAADAEIPAGRTRTGYLVEEGETLDEIARRFHTTEGALRSLNRLGDSDNIYPGRYILVPFFRQAPAPTQLARSQA